MFLLAECDLGSRVISGTSMSPCTVSGPCFSMCFRVERSLEQTPPCYFSILCCLSNIHNKHCGKSLKDCQGSSAVWVYFYIFAPSKYWKQIKSSKIEEPRKYSK